MFTEGALAFSRGLLAQIVGPTWFCPKQNLFAELSFVLLPSVYGQQPCKTGFLFPEKLLVFPALFHPASVPHYLLQPCKRP